MKLRCTICKWEGEPKDAHYEKVGGKDTHTCPNGIRQPMQHPFILYVVTRCAGELKEIHD